MTELLLVRHSITRGNLEKRYIGALDDPLTYEGEELARQRRQAMPQVDKLWVSPMIRCRRTAQLLFPGVAQHLEEGLKECNFGDFEGRTWEQLKDEPVYRAWIGGDYTITFPNGEGMEQFITRCCRSVKNIAQQGVRQGLNRVGIVAHGGTLMVALSTFARPERDLRHWQAENCGAFLARVQPEPFQLMDVQQL